MAALLSDVRVDAYRVRVFCWRMCTHNYWGNFILLCIMVSSGVLAAEDPLKAESPRNEVHRSVIDCSFAPDVVRPSLS